MFQGFLHFDSLGFVTMPTPGPCGQPLAPSTGISSAAGAPRIWWHRNIGGTFKNGLETASTFLIARFGIDQEGSIKKFVRLAPDESFACKRSSVLCLDV